VLDITLVSNYYLVILVVFIVGLDSLELSIIRALLLNKSKLGVGKLPILVLSRNRVKDSSSISK